MYIKFSHTYVYSSHIPLFTYTLCDVISRKPNRKNTSSTRPNHKYHSNEVGHSIDRHERKEDKLARPREGGEDEEENGKERVP